ncbi:MAG: histidine phosphatase family protein [Eubacteriales bacterium]|nr:histidine phosphatase family protein [Eubacteriales bacterium]
MLLYIVRHGDPIYNPDSLTALGKVQANSVAKRLALHGIDKIFSSPLVRARQTAEPTAILTKNEIAIEDWMSEDLAWKDFTVEDDQGGRNWVFQNPDYKAIIRSRKIMSLGHEWYNEDSFSDVFKTGYERILNASDDFFARLGFTHDRENCVYTSDASNDMRVAAFCHQGFSLAWLGVLLDIPLPVIWSSFDISHTNITVIEFHHVKDNVYIPKVLTLSNDSHLYGDNLPTKYNNRIYI